MLTHPDHLTTFNQGDQVFIISRNPNRGPFIVQSAPPHKQGRTPRGSSTPTRIISLLDPGTNEEQEWNSFELVKADDYRERGLVTPGFPE
jgi:hypothetical protein